MQSHQPSIPTRNRRRRSFVVITTAGLALGLAGAVGLTVPLPAFAAATPLSAALQVLPAAASTVIPGNKPLSDITTDARWTLDRGQAALADAASVSSDIAGSGLDLGVDTTIDTSDLQDALGRLSNPDLIPLLLLPGATDAASTQTGAVTQRVATLRTALDGARAAKAAAEAAAAEAQRQAEQAAAEAAAAAALAAANTPAGAQATARQLASSEYGWGDGEFSCLLSLWNRESSWNYQAYNAGSGAAGIPQALPGSKMASVGSDWETNATTQIQWGLRYIAGSYGTPCGAWGHSQSTGWY
ncbi:phospholipase [Microbacterium sp. X-17]|uniref:aggregation-promoting factor C-terminal-like domain-containing protein n=1 Tax=Microbacterium sp. X-17 TaxID=3144404 RepID=UPI0031F4DBAA